MSFKRFVIQFVAAAVAIFVTGAIHYKVHPITEIETAGNAMAVAFSFLPGVLIAYAAMGIERLGGNEEPDAPALGALCGLLWFVYLFRAITLLIGFPVLSDWTEKPVGWLVKSFEFFAQWGS